MKYLLMFLFALVTVGSSAQNRGNAKSKAAKSKKSQVKKKTVSVPGEVSSQFTANYPTASHVSWANSGSNFEAKYMYGPYWSTTTYSATGKVVETKTFIPKANAPKAVMIYKSTNPAFEVGDVVRFEVPGKEPVYRVQIENGQYVYLNDIGLKVSF